MKSSIAELIKDYKSGKMIILLDDENRENEGDLLIPAQTINAKDVNFMATYGRGLVCLTLTQARCLQLKLPLMVHSHDNQAQYGTNFTLSIEAANGVTTGISAADRAKTIQTAVQKNVKPEDIVQPGHIFPIMAKEGGVLTRAGHTEAGCDLARLAGFEPASVIVEILNEDGTMARYDDLVKFSQKHQIKLGTIEDLIRYRLENEKSIQKINEQSISNVYGKFTLTTFKDILTNDIHFALSKGKINKNTTCLVRVHMQNTVSDILQINQNNIPLQTAFSKIGQAESGVLLILRKEREHQLFNQLNIESSQTTEDDIKTFGIGAQILNEIGVGKMCLLGNPRKLTALKGFDLEIMNYEQV